MHSYFFTHGTLPTDRETDTPDQTTREIKQRKSVSLFNRATRLLPSQGRLLAEHALHNTKIRRGLETQTDRTDRQTDR